MPLFIIPSMGGVRKLEKASNWRKVKVVCIPKPPRIGSAYVPKPQFAPPYVNSHHPDQDWIQNCLLYGRITKTKNGENK